MHARVLGGKLSKNAMKLPKDHSNIYHIRNSITKKKDKILYQDKDIFKNVTHDLFTKNAILKNFLKDVFALYVK